MPRIAEGRAPAKPRSPQQAARVERIIRAAARQGAANGLERVQMHDVAKEAGVAIATLYRYFPSKMHLFIGVMQGLIDRIGDETLPPGDDPVTRVTTLLLESTRRMLRAPLLAHAMMVSNNAAIHGTEDDASQTTASFTHLLLATAGKEDPGSRDEQLARLVEQAWYGLLTAAINERNPQEQVEDDLRTMCRLLLVDWTR